MSIVFKDNFRLQKLNKSSKLHPNKSRTKTLWSPSIPNHLMFGIPVGASPQQDNQDHLAHYYYYYVYKTSDSMPAGRRLKKTPYVPTDYASWGPSHN